MKEEYPSVLLANEHPLVLDPHHTFANPLLDALWRSPDRHHQIGVMDRQTKQFNNIPVSGATEAVERALDLSGAGTEVYFACAEYLTPDSREAKNASGASAFWMDLDCSVKKFDAGVGYRTIEDAQSELRRFCSEAGLPEPTHIVSSGGGLHVYWALDGVVERKNWQAYAVKLKALTKAHSLLADSSRTADIASVLRIPGTNNHKYDPPAPVTLLHASATSIDRSSILNAIDSAHSQLAPRPPAMAPSPRIHFEPQSQVVNRLNALLGHIDPDCEYDPWVRVLMAIFHETGGSEEGRLVAEAWSSKGEKYKGNQEIRDKWCSFSPDQINPITIATLYNMVEANGVDWRAVCEAAEPQFEPCDYVVIDPDAPSPGERVGADNPLDKFSLRGRAHEVEEQAVAQVPILGQIALMGQATIFYAAPNTGKTLITISLLVDAISHGLVEPSQVYYINVDDTAKGLAEKLRIADEYGFHMLAEGYRDFNASHLLGIVNTLVEDDLGRGVVIILDTLKKFTDLMDKTKSSSFSKVIRRFVLKGGTLIALAHTNKNPGRNGKPVYGGTSDIIDDSDCAYVLAPLAAESGEKVVEFENIKRRGNVAPSAAYSYSLERGLSYHGLLLSVRPVDEMQLVPLKQAEQLRSDAEVIDAVIACISEGVNTKMRLVDAASERAGISKRSALKVIEKHTGDEPALHKWKFAVRERGAKVFVLLDSTAHQGESHD